MATTFKMHQAKIRLSSLVARAMEGEDIIIARGDAPLAGRLPISHRDPFDRLLIAQAQIEQAALVSTETLFDQFGVRRLWQIRRSPPPARVPRPVVPESSAARHRRAIPRGTA